jgi:hypothetical protein
LKRNLAHLHPIHVSDAAISLYPKVAKKRVTKHVKIFATRSIGKIKNNRKKLEGSLDVYNTLTLI